MTRILAVPILLLCAVQVLAQNNVKEDAFRVLRSINVESGETVGDVQCAACNVRIRGHVTGDVVTFGGNVSVEGSVDGDVVAIGGRIDLRSPGKIAGDAAAIGGYINGGTATSVDGDKFSAPYAVIPGQYQPTILGSLLLAALNFLFVLIAFVVLQLRRVDNIAQVIRHRTPLVVLAGVVALPLFFGLFWLCQRLGRAGVWAELVVLLLLVVIAAAGAAGVGFSVAKFAFPSMRGVGMTLAGTLVLSLLEIVPLLGFVVFAVGLLLALGGALISVFGSRGAPAPVEAS
jgi:hypothetical protein